MKIQTKPQRLEWHILCLILQKINRNMTYQVDITGTRTQSEPINELNTSVSSNPAYEDKMICMFSNRTVPFQFDFVRTKMLSSFEKILLCNMLIGARFKFDHFKLRFTSRGIKHEK